MSTQYTPIPSVLHVIAKEIDVSKDLNSTSDKTISELLDEEKEKSHEKEQTTK